MVLGKVLAIANPGLEGIFCGPRKAKSKHKHVDCQGVMIGGATHHIKVAAQNIE